MDKKKFNNILAGVTAILVITAGIGIFYNWKIRRDEMSLSSREFLCRQMIYHAIRDTAWKPATIMETILDNKPIVFLEWLDGTFMENGHCTFTMAGGIESIYLDQRRGHRVIRDETEIYLLNSKAQMDASRR